MSNTNWLEAGLAAMCVLWGVRAILWPSEEDEEPSDYPFTLTSESADAERGARIRQKNAHVFTNWTEFRGFIAMNYPDMTEEMIAEFLEYWQSELMTCKPGETMYYIATPHGTAAVTA